MGRQGCRNSSYDLRVTEIAYETNDGIADFHCLPHTFIGNLVSGEIHLTLAQQPARRSNFTLRMGWASCVGRGDMTGELESLSKVSASDHQTLRARGASDEAANPGCTSPAEITRCHPRLNCLIGHSDDFGPKQESPQIPAENEGFLGYSTVVEEEAPVGFEPTRDGFAIRCLSHLATEPKAGGM